MRSSWKGQRPLKLAPAFLSSVYWPTTSTMSAAADDLLDAALGDARHVSAPRRRVAAAPRRSRGRAAAAPRAPRGGAAPRSSPAARRSRPAWSPGRAGAASSAAAASARSSCQWWPRRSNDQTSSDDEPGHPDEVERAANSAQASSVVVSLAGGAPQGWMCGSCSQPRPKVTTAGTKARTMRPAVTSAMSAVRRSTRRSRGL